MAHNFLLFVFVFATTLVAGFSSILKLPPSENGKTISILSLDGGGMKGIIQAVVLDHLDKALKAKEPTASLADYFDVIAGTSTGGIMTAMLAAPNSSNANRPVFTPYRIIQFYKENGPHIFNKSSPGKGPAFDGVYLHDIAKQLLKETRLSETLTNVVIPTFDIKELKPIIFSNYQVETDPYLNAKLSDIIIGTSVAPTILPPYQFKNDNVEFNLVDGALTADNPAMAAACEVMQHEEEVSEILLLSLGTGKTKIVEKYNANDAAHWNWINWIADLIHSSSPILEMVQQSSTDIVPYYLATVFPGFMPLDNYLRIQEYDLDPSLDDMTNVEQENLNNLVKVGKNLLQQKVKRINVNTFQPYEVDQINAQALDSFAEKLYEQKQLRLKRKSMKKGGRPFIETA